MSNRKRTPRKKHPTTRRQAKHARQGVPPFPEPSVPSGVGPVGMEFSPDPVPPTQIKWYIDWYATALSYPFRQLLSQLRSFRRLSSQARTHRQARESPEDRVRATRLSLREQGIHLSDWEIKDIFYPGEFRRPIRSPNGTPTPPPYLPIASTETERYRRDKARSRPFRPTTPHEAALLDAAKPDSPQNGDHQAQLELGTLLESQGNPEAENWFYWAATGGYHRGPSPYEQ